MKNLVEGLILIIAFCAGLAWLVSTPVQADVPAFQINTLRDDFACPGAHAEWLEDRTVQCLKEIS
ncbi:hypothetical protein SR914_24930 [Comamonas testosteroni]|jgi:hypothetical protein|uniref:hypothetical protein n=1 Tax=Comamonas TaxID=283 RepID=UPI0009B6C7E2|nr:MULTISPECIES: hypothetical protein [Comamonas]TYK73604.1 hypothetical protein FSY59_03115 [Comamonas sp. Z3]WQG66358.1 hypothetical protein SR914_24930 [Comamonas testosteroni]